MVLIIRIINCLLWTIFCYLKMLTLFEKIATLKHWNQHWKHWIQYVLPPYPMLATTAFVPLSHFKYRCYIVLSFQNKILSIYYQVIIGYKKEMEHFLKPICEYSSRRENQIIHANFPTSGNWKFSWSIVFRFESTFMANLSFVLCFCQA